VSEEERRRFAAPPAEGWMRGIDLGLLDPSDPDERRLLIEAEHPELHEALDAGYDEIELDGNVMNPHLHISMHEVVANQLWDDDPPETWATAQRLTALRYERHEVLHMLASVVADQTWRTLRHRERFDLARLVAGLEDLPRSWEAMRRR
jgi:hypothetical protein